MADTEELCSTKLRLWSRLVTGHQLFGTRFSEGVDAVKDMTEDEIGHVSDKLLHDTADGVKKDIAAGNSNSALQGSESKLKVVQTAGFSKYGHHMWNLS
mmetsp:Transcript_44660/g.93463  ORF Transcript_44660/g.93463 Transcript_44660/m.93463 type:complete len:99 (-) Transcript_44660:308-604(-)